MNTKTAVLIASSFLLIILPFYGYSQDRGETLDPLNANPALIITKPILHIQAQGEAVLSGREEFFYKTSIELFEEHTAGQFDLIHGQSLDKRAFSAGVDLATLCSPKGAKARTSAQALGGSYLICQEIVELSKQNYYYQLRIYGADQNVLIYNDSVTTKDSFLKSVVGELFKRAIPTLSKTKHIQGLLQPDRADLPRGDLFVTATPPGSTIMVNGQTYGVTPQKISLPEGKFWLTVSSAGFRSQSSFVEVNKNKETKVFYKLEPIASRITLNTTPEGAAVYMNGTMVGFTPLYEMIMPSGGGQEINVLVVKEGYISESFNLTPFKGEKYVEKITLQELSDMLVVQTYSNNLQLMIDKDQSRVIPLEYAGLHRLYDLTKGDHTLEVFKGGQKIYTTTVGVPTTAVIPLPENLDITQLKVKPKTIRFQEELAEDKIAWVKAPGMLLVGAGIIGMSYAYLQLQASDKYMKESYLRLSPEERLYFERQSKSTGETGWTSMNSSSLMLALGAMYLHFEW